jgi:MinD superfamily P-loop ATPase
MRIAVASGKGGTGKTTVAVSLALSIKRAVDAGGGRGRPPLFLDCDVEAPNAHLFLNPDLDEEMPATVPVPSIDTSTCTKCGDCAEVCRFNALAVLGEDVLLFPELCHGCGSCMHACTVKAITEIPKQVGCLEEGEADGIRFAHGKLNVGEAMAVPVIRQLKKWEENVPGQLTILDAPPGTSCPMVETVMGSDYVILVTEPTPFGLHDLALAVQVVRELGLPMGIVINRDGIGDLRLEDFCASENLPILLRIPFDRGIAQGIAQGKTLLEVRPEYEFQFREIVEHIRERASQMSPAEAKIH